jgi:hypothetical protein
MVAKKATHARSRLRRNERFAMQDKETKPTASTPGILPHRPKEKTAWRGRAPGSG